jgi:hypothetical protein
MSELELQSKTHNLDPAHNEADRQEIVRASHELARMLDAQNIDPHSVFLRGVSRGDEKFPDGDEFDLGDGKRQLSFGTLEDTMPPEITTADPLAEEKVEEAWVVNPLKYALEKGYLRVYDRDRVLAKASAEDEDGYGTVIAEMSADELHKSGSLYRDYPVLKDPKVGVMTEAQFVAYDASNTELMEQQWKEVGIAPDSGIVRIDVVDDEGKVTQSHYYNTSTQNNGANYGDELQRVIEIGRDYEVADDPYIAEELGDTALDEVGISDPGDVPSTETEATSPEPDTAPVESEQHVETADEDTSVNDEASEKAAKKLEDYKLRLEQMLKDVDSIKNNLQNDSNALHGMIDQIVHELQMGQNSENLFQASGMYLAELDKFRNNSDHNASRLDMLSHQSQELGKNDFEAGSDNAKLREAFLSIQNDVANFMNANGNCIYAFRHLMNAVDRRDQDDAFMELRQMLARNDFATLMGMQDELKRRITESLANI